MVEISDIVDEESLLAWFEALPQETEEDERRARKVGLTIAFRAAARGFPLAVSDLRNDPGLSDKAGDTVLAVYRCLITAYFAACVSDKYPDPVVIEAARDAHMRVSQVGHVANATSAPNYSTIGAAAFASASAVYISTTPFIGPYISSTLVGSSAYLAVSSDISVLASGQHLNNAPLWPRNVPYSESWPSSCKKLQDAPDDWSPIIAWYEHVLRPENTTLSVEMLREIVAISPNVWESGPGIALPKVNAIWRKYEPEPPSALDLMDAALFDFTLDSTARVLRAVRFPQDWKKLTEPDALAAFISDAEDLRESLLTLTEVLNIVGGPNSAAAVLSLYVQKILNELEHAPDRNALNVGKLLEWGRHLEGAQSEDLSYELGIAAKPFAETVGTLRTLIRRHFSALLVRLSDLRSIRLEDGEEASAVVRDVRIMIDAARSGTGKLLPMAAEDAAVLEDMLESVDRVLLRLSSTDSADLAESARREIDLTLAKEVSTLDRYRMKAMEFAGRGDAAADTAIKYHKKGEGLMALTKRLLDLMPGGGT